VAMTEEQKTKLATKIMMQGAKETHARHAAEIITLFRAVKAFAWTGQDVSDEAAAALTSAIWVRS
jgi:hypothetical protein